MNWSDESRRVVFETLSAIPTDATLQDKRKALRKAYPFGPRKYWPYKAWCKAVRDALGLTKAQDKLDVVRDTLVASGFLMLFGDDQ